MLNYFQTIMQTDNFIRIPLEEATECDPVFFNNDAGRKKDDIHNDIDYKDPDYKQWIFHTTSIANLFVQYPNNLILPIRDKMELKNAYFLHKELNMKTNENGVYIIDVYRLCPTYSNTEDFLQSIANYCGTTHNVYGYVSDIRSVLKEKLRVWTKSNYHKLKPITLRIVTFIPESELIKNNKLYLISNGITIGSGEIKPDLVHPNSAIYKDHHKVIECDLGNHIEIDIQDPYTGQMYYINIGNEVYPVKSNHSKDREPKAIINVHHGLDTISTRSSSLEEMGEKLGIFKTESDAKYNGNHQLLNDKIRLENEYNKLLMEKESFNYKADIEKQKLELEMLKIQYSLSKLEHDKELMELELNKLREEHKMAMSERQLAKECRHDEHVIKMEHLIASHKAEEQKKKQDRLCMLKKHVMELEYMEAKSIYDGRMNAERMKLEQQKSKFGVLNNLLSFSSAVFKIL